MRVPLVPGAPEKDAARSGLLRSEFSPYRAIIDGICHRQSSPEGLPRRIRLQVDLASLARNCSQSATMICMFPSSAMIHLQFLCEHA